MKATTGVRIGKTMFYNTIEETGGQLFLFQKMTRVQDNAVMDFFLNNPRSACTPSFIHLHVLQDCPITSLRRTLTDLTQAGYLQKLKKKTMGPWGKNEHYWRLKLS